MKKYREFGLNIFSMSKISADETPKRSSDLGLSQVHQELESLEKIQKQEREKEAKCGGSHL